MLALTMADLACEQTSAKRRCRRMDGGFRAKAEITTGGLILIAATVSSILISTAVLVQVAVSAQQRKC